MEFQIKRGKKQNNLKSGAALAKKERKRKEAAERQAKYDALSLDQKIARAGVFPNGKEYARLVAKKAALAK